MSLIEDPILLNCKCGAEYLIMKIQPFKDNLNAFLNTYNAFKSENELDKEKFSDLLKYLSQFTTLVYDVVVSGKITSITAAALEQAEGIYIKYYVSLFLF